MTDGPPTAATDLGQTDWEQRLIRESDATAGTPRRGVATTIETATSDDIREFLSDLATRQRVSASTQKQTLNALARLPLLEVCGHVSG